MLDALANNKAVLLDYQQSFNSYSRKRKQLAELKQQAATSDQALDFIKFQLNEFDEANIQPGEIGLNGILRANPALNAVRDLPP